LPNYPQEDKIERTGGIMKGKLILRVMILLLLSLTALSDSEMEVRKR